MNIQRVIKLPVIHKVVEACENELITGCGKWLDKERFLETTEDVTCKKCLEHLKGCSTFWYISVQEGGNHKRD